MAKKTVKLKGRNELYYKYKSSLVKRMMIAFIALLILQGMIGLFLLNLAKESINSKAEILNSNFDWICSNTETIENWTVSDDFDSADFCDAKHCQKESMAQQYLGVERPSWRECQQKCHAEYASEIDELQKPRLIFYNETYCVQEKLVVKEIYRDSRYKITE